MPTVGVVIVTYNSARFIDACFAALEQQTHIPDRVVVVDSGSNETSYLTRVDASPLATTLLRIENVGVCIGNNLGWAACGDVDYLLYLNPDAFLAADFLEKAMAYMEDPANGKVGLVTGSLLGYDIEENSPTGLIDTTGVVQLWYGRIVDRDQSKPVATLERYKGPNEVPSICSAVVLCRKEAIVSIAPTGEVFDPRYFMYKDDIDFSWRANRAGWLLIHHPALTAYHCRGWKTRTAQSRYMRVLCARNDVKLFLKFRSPYLLWGLAKYFLVYAFDL